MILLDCLVGLMLSMILLNPLLMTAGKWVNKQMEFEKTQILMADGERALELIGRAIRMAGYTNIYQIQIPSNSHKNHARAAKRVTKIHNHQFIHIEKNAGYRGSDHLQIKHGISGVGDLDCIGNVLTQERTRHDLALQGFRVEYPAGLLKGARTNGGSLICQSLDRQGRLQHSTLMNGVQHMQVEELKPIQANHSGTQRAFRIRLHMTDGHGIQLELQRTFTTRNLL